MLHQTEYMRSLYKVCLCGYWFLLQMYGYQAAENWFEHVPCRTTEEVRNATVLCSYDIQTGSVASHRCPGIIVLDKGTKNCHVIR